jgi:hypothetical protein
VIDRNAYFSTIVRVCQIWCPRVQGVFEADQTYVHIRPVSQKTLTATVSVAAHARPYFTQDLPETGTVSNMSWQNVALCARARFPGGSYAPPSGRGRGTTMKLTGVAVDIVTGKSSMSLKKRVEKQIYQITVALRDLLMTGSLVRMGTSYSLAVATSIRSCSSGTSSTSLAIRTTSSSTGKIT